MANINLLPWREQKREQEKKLFNSTILLGVLIAAAIVIIANYSVTTMVNHQISLNDRLNQEIRILDGEIEEIKKLKLVRAALISRMKVVQSLQSTRALTVHLFDELIKVMPQGIYVTKLERKEDLVTVWGYSESNTDISNLMRNIERNAWIQQPSLTEIKKSEAGAEKQDSEFRLSFILKPKTL